MELSLASYTRSSRRRGVAAFVCFITFATLASALAAENKKIRIVLVGDSTVTDKAGWGGAIGAFFKDNVEILNHARGGRSSKSYINEGHWKKALAEKPDYVLIQFGHNDCPGKGPKRETDPETTYTDYMKRYATEARKIGAKPILITSVTRRNFDERGKIKSTLVPYAAAVRRIGKETNTPVIDLHARSVELFERLGDTGCDRLQPKGDHTHFNAEGAKAIAKLVAEELPKADSKLAEALR